VKARYVVGLTATPQRRDGHHPIAEMHLGPVRFRVDAKSQAARRPFHHKLIVRETEFHLSIDSPNAGIQEIYRVIANDAARNTDILNDVLSAIQEGRSPILLTERKDHLEFFAERLRGFVRHLIVLQGGMTTAPSNNSRRFRMRPNGWSSQQVVTSVKGSTMLGSIRSFSRCRSLGRGR
jgi:hypothetical protein